MTKLYRYQKENIKRMEELDGRVLLACEMGLGKTVQAIMYAYRNNIRPIVVVCPAHLKYHWQREFAHHCGWYAQVLEGMKPPKGILMRSSKIIIVNPTILGGWRRYIRKLRPKLLILDEAQDYKNPAALRTQRVKKISTRVDKVIAISGTPFTSRPAELWSILNILWPKKYKNFWQYAHRYCKPRLRRWGWTFPGAVNLDILHRQLTRRGMIRRLKKDVLKDLPKMSKTILPVTIANDKEYREAEHQFALWLRKNFSASKAKRAKSAERLVQFGYLKRLAARGKMQAVMDWIDNFLDETDGKLIVFAIHRSFIADLMKKYGKMAVRIQGGMSAIDRQKAVDDFSKSKRCRIIFCNIQAGGTGWNGTAASTTLLAELPWTPGEIDQAAKRMDRIGQKMPMNFTIMVAKGTIEEKLCKMLDEKQGVLSATLDGDERVGAMNIIARLTKSLMRGAA